MLGVTQRLYVCWLLLLVVRPSRQRLRRSPAETRDHEDWPKGRRVCFWVLVVLAVLFVGLAAFLPPFAWNMFSQQITANNLFNTPDALGYPGFVSSVFAAMCLRILFQLLATAVHCCGVALRRVWCGGGCQSSAVASTLMQRAGGNGSMNQPIAERTNTQQVDSTYNANRSFDMYVFEVLNPDGFVSRGEKLHVKEHGPFVYNMRVRKLNVTFNDTADEVTYREWNTFEFDAAVGWLLFCFCICLQQAVRNYTNKLSVGGSAGGHPLLALLRDSLERVSRLRFASSTCVRVEHHCTPSKRVWTITHAHVSHAVSYTHLTLPTIYSV